MEKQVTNGAQWRQGREQGFVITLPSGNVVRVRPVALDMLILSGKLPDLLTPIAAKTLWTETDTAAIGDQAELAKNFAELVNIVVPAALLEPRVVENPQAEDEISLQDIDFGDKVAVFQLATQSTETLRRFRDQQAADVDALPDGQNDQQPTE